MWPFKKKLDPYCRACGCPMQEEVGEYGRPVYDRKTGKGKQMMARTWVCSRYLEPPERMGWYYNHHENILIDTYYVEVTSKCAS